jgi:hypothetical protein
LCRKGRVGTVPVARWVFTQARWITMCHSLGLR